MKPRLSKDLLVDFADAMVIESAKQGYNDILTLLRAFFMTDYDLGRSELEPQTYSEPDAAV